MSVLWQMSRDVALSVVTCYSCLPQPRAQPSPRRGPQMRSGEEPGSDTPNFSSSVNNNGEYDNDETFWGNSQHPQAPCEIFHGVPGHCAGQLRRLTMFLNILSHQRTQGSLYKSWLCAAGHYSKFSSLPRCFFTVGRLCADFGTNSNDNTVFKVFIM